MPKYEICGRCHNPTIDPDDNMTGVFVQSFSGKNMSEEDAKKKAEQFWQRRFGFADVGEVLRMTLFKIDTRSNFSKPIQIYQPKTKEASDIKLTK